MDGAADWLGFIGGPVCAIWLQLTAAGARKDITSLLIPNPRIEIITSTRRFLGQPLTIIESQKPFC